MRHLLSLVASFTLATVAHAAPTKAPVPTTVQVAKARLADARAALKRATADARQAKRHHKGKSVKATEETCRAIARKGETWEDACERVFKISPDAWDINTGKLHDPGLALGCGTCVDNHDNSCTCPPVHTATVK